MTFFKRHTLSKKRHFQSEEFWKLIKLVRKESWERPTKLSITFYFNQRYIALKLDATQNANPLELFVWAIIELLEILVSFM